MTIQFSNFSFRYDTQTKPTLKNINLTIHKGEKVLIIGPSGSGKSTLSQCINGLIPHAIQGEISGECTINGHSTQSMSLNECTEYVGTVLQDTDSQFVGLTVGEDIAFSLENQCVPVAEIYPIVKKTAKMVDLENLLHASPQDLSGGQKQRVSLAGIMVDDVDVLLFDEPLAALDPKTAQRTIEIIDEIHRTTHKTILIVEHRLEDVLLKPVDRIILINQGEIIEDTTPDELLASDLLNKHGIREPLYLSALRKANCHFTAKDLPAHFSKMSFEDHAEKLKEWANSGERQATSTQQEKVLSFQNVSYSYDGNRLALDDLSFDLYRGEMVSILGKNGSGKSTITKLIMGVISPDQGQIQFGQDPADHLTIFERSKRVGVVMQNPNHMISHHMIMDEVAFGLRNMGLSETEIQQRVLDTLTACGLRRFRHWPVDALSYGQKKRLTIASILVMEPEILILDEPTAGQDHAHYSAMLELIRHLNQKYKITVIMISHDLHLVLEHTQRSIVISDSKQIADASMTQVFSEPALLDQANLTTTSLYELAKKTDIQDINGFMQTFIQTEVSC